MYLTVFIYDAVRTHFISYVCGPQHSGLSSSTLKDGVVRIGLMFEPTRCSHVNFTTTMHKVYSSRYFFSP